MSGNAVVVMGDTNTRYTRAADTIAAFAANNGLTDAWVQLTRGGVPPTPGSDPLLCDPAAVTNACEVVDKVLYRGSKLVSLAATNYNNEHAAFLNSSGVMLSDHDPITVRFAWSASTAYLLSEQFGGPHGGFFNDITRVPPGGRATTVALRAGARVDQLTLTLNDGTTLTHGGTATSLTLGNDEYVTAVTLCRARTRDTPESSPPPSPPASATPCRAAHPPRTASPEPPRPAISSPASTAAPATT